MAFDVTVQGTTYSIPEAGDPPGWGQELSSFFLAISEAINDLVTIDDILQTAFSVQNNISSYTNVAGLVFNTASARGGKISYTVYRSTTTNEIAEEGTMSIIFRNSAAVWEMSREYTGEAGMEFDITSAGQVQYKSSNVSGSSYSGTMRFRAAMIQQ